MLEERGCSYPDGLQAEGGRIYQVYDQGSEAVQIPLAVFTEEDVAAGKPVSGHCRLQVPVTQTASQFMKK